MTDYQEALVYEILTRPPGFSHPVRAAQALKRLNEGKLENFAANLLIFKREANHSRLYPETVKLTSLFIPLCALVIGTWMIAMAPTPLAISLLVLGGLGLIFGASWPHCAYYDVEQAKTAANGLYGFFKNSSISPSAATNPRLHIPNYIPNLHS